MGAFIADIFTAAGSSIAMNDSWLIANNISTTDIVTGASFKCWRIWDGTDYGQATGDTP